MPPQAKDRAKPTSISGADARKALADQESAEIKVKLAHPLNEGNPFTKEGAPAEVGDEITLPRSSARSLISAGYAAVDAEDREAVAAALELGPAAPGENPPSGD